jgi:A/G-specific adenine glycosylase
VRHAYSHFKITLTAFLCRAVKGRATARESAEVRWVAPDELSRYPFPTANRKVLEALKKHLG